MFVNMISNIKNTVMNKWQNKKHILILVSYQFNGPEINDQLLFTVL